MNRHARLSAIVLTLFAGTALAATPGRPAALTPAQYRALVHIEQQPEHAAVLDVQATYTSERDRSMEATRLSDDFWTVAYDAGLPGSILIVLICAAPL